MNKAVMLTMTARQPSGSGSRTAWGRALAVILTGLAGVGSATAASAFHDGGAATCERCHVMHDSGGGAVAMDGSRPLLLADTATDVCLTCHGDNGVFGLDPLNPPVQLGAGNFAYLLEDNLNDASDGLISPIPGEAAGHSLTSLILGIGPDSRWSQAPGGVFPSHELGCTSCHDPHGNTNFRMLNGVGSIQNGAGVFVNPAPVALGLDATDPQASESPASHTAYVSGMSAWCANCHGLYHDRTGADNFAHPVEGSLSPKASSQYNRYEGSASPASGQAATAYLPEVPFEDPTMTATATAGPTAGSSIMCLTCHRVHGSSAPASGRWDFRVPTLEQDGVISGSYPIASPFPGPAEPQLCRKCHDESHSQGDACIACHAANSTLIRISE